MVSPSHDALRLFPRNTTTHYIKIYGSSGILPLIHYLLNINSLADLE